MVDIVETPLHCSVYSQQSPTSVEEGTFSGFFQIKCAYIPLCQHATLLRRWMGDIKFPPTMNQRAV